jgi:nitrate reductase NapE component
MRVPLAPLLLAPVLLAPVLLVAFLGCGGSEEESFAVYHLELAVGPPGEEGELRCGPPRACPGIVAQPSPRSVRYEVLGPPGVDGDDVDRTTARSAGTAVSVDLTADGREAFARLTREVARHGGRDQGWHHLAVVIGDEIVAFPEIDFDAYPDGIRDAPGIELSAVDPADAAELAQRIGEG